MAGNADTFLIPPEAGIDAKGSEARCETEKAVLPPATAEASAAGSKDGYDVGETSMAPAAADAFRESSQGMLVLVKRLTDNEALKLEVKGQDTVTDLKSLIHEHLGTPPQVQKLLIGRMQLQEDNKALEDYGVKTGTLLTLLVVEVPKEEKDITTWDVLGNSRHEQLTVSGCLLTCPSLVQDYVSVVTRAPVSKGRHYFQFIMHMIGDEGSVGATPFPEQANSNPFQLKGWIYYCGRMNSRWATEGGLDFMDLDSGAVSRSPAPKTQSKGDVVGMAIDFDAGKIAFDLNGMYAGGANISRMPLWIIATVDDPDDAIEIKKPPLSEIPQMSLSILAESQQPKPQ